MCYLATPGGATWLFWGDKQREATGGWRWRGNMPVLRGWDVRWVRWVRRWSDEQP